MEARPTTGRLARVVLVLVDISGYTSFIKHRAVSLLHAEAIVTELIEAVIDRAHHPLTLNKLEGDAALLYSEVDGDLPAACRDALSQASQFFSAFGSSLRSLEKRRRHCSCDACAHIADLRLKAILHTGEIAIKRVRQLEELAGEDVILIHRLLKNTVGSSEYMLITEEFHDAVGAPLPEWRAHEETLDAWGGVPLWWLGGAALHALVAASSSMDGVREARRASVAGVATPSAAPREFHHLPHYRVGWFRVAWDRLIVGALMLLRRRG